MGTVTAPLTTWHALFDTLEVSQLDAGFSPGVLSDFIVSSGLAPKSVYEIVIPPRTLKHRLARRQNLSRDESDKLIRLVKAFDHTVRVFGNQEKALRWLSKPKERFAGASPLELLQTEFGGSKVDELLWQIADGMFV